MKLIHFVELQKQLLSDYKQMDKDYREFQNKQKESIKKSLEKIYPYVPIISDSIDYKNKPLGKDGILLFTHRYFNYYLLEDRTFIRIKDNRRRPQESIQEGVSLDEIINNKSYHLLHNLFTAINSIFEEIENITKELSNLTNTDDAKDKTIDNNNPSKKVKKEINVNKTEPSNQNKDEKVKKVTNKEGKENQDKNSNKEVVEKEKEIKEVKETKEKEIKEIKEEKDDITEKKVIKKKEELPDEVLAKKGEQFSLDLSRLELNFDDDDENQEDNILNDLEEISNESNKIDKLNSESTLEIVKEDNIEEQDDSEVIDLTEKEETSAWDNDDIEQGEEIIDITQVDDIIDDIPNDEPEIKDPTSELFGNEYEDTDFEEEHHLGDNLNQEEIEEDEEDEDEDFEF